MNQYENGKNILFFRHKNGNILKYIISSLYSLLYKSIKRRHICKSSSLLFVQCQLYSELILMVTILFRNDSVLEIN